MNNKSIFGLCFLYISYNLWTLWSPEHYLQSRECVHGVAQYCLYLYKYSISASTGSWRGLDQNGYFIIINCQCYHDVPGNTEDKCWSKLGAGGGGGGLFFIPKL